MRKILRLNTQEIWLQILHFNLIILGKVRWTFSEVA